jgi:hypothetical protein
LPEALEGNLEKLTNDGFENLNHHRKTLLLPEALEGSLQKILLLPEALEGNLDKIIKIWKVKLRVGCIF